MKDRRGVRANPARGSVAELDIEETLIAPAPRPRRKIRATRRGLWTPRRVIALALAIGAVTRQDLQTLPKGEKLADRLHLR